MQKSEKILWFSALGIFTAGLVVFMRSIKDKLTATAKQNRQIIACRQDACTMLNGMVTKFDLPMYNLAFYLSTDIATITSKLNAIKSQFGNLITSISSLTNLPETLLRSFVFIESGGNPNALSGKSIGLMQIDPVTAHGMIFLENKKGRLSDAEKTVLRKYIGTRLDLITKDKWMNQTQHILNTDLYNPEFNLLVGAIYLGILVDEHTEGDVLRLDKIISRYNRGYFSKSGLTGNPLAVYNNQPSVTRAYILKLAGKNGVLDIMT